MVPERRAGGIRELPPDRGFWYVPRTRFSVLTDSKPVSGRLQQDEGKDPYETAG